MQLIERSEPSTDEERGHLRRGLWGVLAFTLFAALIFAAIFAIVWDADIFAIVTVSGMAVFFVLVIGVTARATYRDLRASVTKVLEGTITEKGMTRGHKGPGRYELHFGERRIPVQLSNYTRANVGDLVSLRMSARSGTVFSIDVKVRGDAPERASAVTAAGEVTEEVWMEAPLTAEDRRVLAKKYRRELVWRSAAGLVAFYMFGYFLFEGQYGLLLVLSPVVLLFLYEIYAIVRVTRRYRADLEAGMKYGRTRAITDKQRFSGRRKHALLVSGRESFDVPDELFEQISIGDRITEYSVGRTGFRVSIDRA